LCEILPCAAARINIAKLDQPMQRGDIDRLAFTLKIWSERTADIRPFLPANSQPSEIFHRSGRKLRPGSLRVEVFHPKHQLTSGCDRSLTRRPEGGGMANMKISRRRRRNAAAIGGQRTHSAKSNPLQVTNRSLAAKLGRTVYSIGKDKMSANSGKTLVEPVAGPAASAIHIRRFQPGDEAGFQRLNEEWIVRHFALEQKDRDVLGDPVKYILEPGGQILFAVHGGDPIGCCALIREEAGVFEVAKMGVTAAYQGQGIGQRLLEAVIDEAGKMGASRLRLETNSKLGSATHLYEKFGFRHVPVERLKPSLYRRADVFMEMVLR
jgi:putative acetyltransferase